MENKTTEERAEEYATSTVCFKLDSERPLMCEKFSGECVCSRKKAAYEQYVTIATEQDRIARNEEKERTIEDCINYLVEQGIVMSWNCFTANKMREALRKAIEEGGEE